MKLILKKLHILVLYTLVTQQAFSQEPVYDKTVSILKEEYSVAEIVELLLIENAVDVSYGNNIATDQNIIKLKPGNYSLKDILDQLSAQQNIKYILQGESIILTKSVPKYFSIGGTVKDSLTGESLPYSTVMVKGYGNGVVANEYGFYSIKCPAGNQEIICSFLGYSAKTIKVKPNKDIRVDISLPPQTNAIEGVVVKSSKGIDATERRLSTINMKNVQKLPSLLGEPDLLRSVQMLPGVSSIAEVGGGFNVRGSAGDQNLIILDEAIVYNASHLFGTYSVFNPDIIKNVKFYKGGIPANYGGRLSSVMDISQKDGNMKEFHGSGGLGLISSRLTLEGPIAKDKASFIVSARKSYVDVFFKNLSEESLIYGVRASFYDINAKLNYIVNKNNRIYLSGYFGNDVLRVDNYNQEYGNVTATLRLNHIYNSKLFSNTSLIYSNYRMFDGESFDQNDWKNKIGLKHYELKHEFTYYTHKNKIEVGLNGIYYKFFPGELQSGEEESGYKALEIPTQKAFESAVYVNDIYTINKKIEILAGLRFSTFSYLGEEDIYIYEENIPRSINTVTDTLSYNNNEIIKTYNSIEPRVSIKYSPNTRNSFKLSYNKTTQYLHLISNTITPSPYDMWKPSNKHIKPMTGHQVSLGYFTNLLNSSVELSAETFYKKTQNTIEVKPGADITLNKTLDADLIDGKGKAYGFEVMLNKTTGKRTGIISYTYTRSLRKVNSVYSEKGVLPTGFYPSNYDIPHKITIAYSSKINQRLKFSANFVYSTGRPITLPDGQYFYFGNLIPHYSGINQHRMPDYHRLDIAWTLYGKKKPNKKWSGYWVFSVYNLYARKNAYSIYIKRKEQSRDTEAIQLSIFGSVVPSISYFFKF